MKRNMFGEPKPKGYEEMLEALDEAGAVAAESFARIEHNENDGDYTGWTADVMHETGETIFDTLGYEDKDALIADLKSLGITEIEED